MFFTIFSTFAVQHLFDHLTLPNCEGVVRGCPGILQEADHAV